MSKFQSPDFEAANIDPNPTSIEDAYEGMAQAEAMNANLRRYGSINEPVLARTYILGLIRDLEALFIGSMTPCSLAHLCHFASQTLPELAFGFKRSELNAPLESRLFDNLLEDLHNAGFVEDHEHLIMVITDAGKAFLEGSDGKALQTPTYLETVDALRHLSSGYQGPYGMRLLALMNDAHWEDTIDGAISRCKDIEPDVQDLVWTNTGNRILTFREDVAHITNPRQLSLAAAAQLLLDSPEFSQIGSFPIARATHEALRAIHGEPVQGDALACIRSALRAVIEQSRLG